MKKLLFVGAVLATAAVAAAGEKCQTMRGVLQSYLDPAQKLWVNEIHALVDETTMVTGAMTPIIRASTTIDRGIGVDAGGVSLWEFGADGTLTTEGGIGLHLRPAPGPQGFGLYRGMGKIVDGTGMFKKATGTVVFEGSWVLWFLPGDPPTPQGRWNADVTMRICKGE